MASISVQGEMFGKQAGCDCALLCKPWYIRTRPLNMECPPQLWVWLHVEWYSAVKGKGCQNPTSDTSRWRWHWTGAGTVSHFNGPLSPGLWIGKYGQLLMMQWLCLSLWWNRAAFEGAIKMGPALLLCCDSHCHRLHMSLCRWAVQPT